MRPCAASAASKCDADFLLRTGSPVRRIGQPSRVRPAAVSTASSSAPSVSPHSLSAARLRRPPRSSQIFQRRGHRLARRVKPGERVVQLGELAAAVACVYANAALSALVERAQILLGLCERGEFHF